MRIVRHEVVKPDGSRGIFHVHEKEDFVVVIARKGNRFFLVEQERFTIGKRSLEFPMGGMELGESPEETARRELREETGLTCDILESIGYSYVANGFSTQGFHVFVGEVTKENPTHHPEGSESDLVVVEYTLKELKKLIRKDILTDAPSLAAFGIYLVKRTMA